MKTVQETLDLFGYHGGVKEPYILEYRISEYYILEPYIFKYRILEYYTLEPYILQKYKILSSD